MNEVAEKKKMTGAWVGLIASLLYVVGPIDLIPDVVPVVGWFDDLMIGAVGVLNFFQHQAQTANSSLASIVKLIKWILIVITIVAVSLILLFGALIFSLFSK